MQSFRTISVIAAMAVVAPGMAWAEERAKPCAEAQCAARDAGVRTVDAAAQCRRIVRDKGPVSRLMIGGRELADAELRACNRFVVTTQRPRN